MPVGDLNPLLRAACSFARLPRPVGALAAWRVDDPGNMSAGGPYKPHVTAKQLRDAPGRVPGHHVVLLRSHRIRVLANATKINCLTFERDIARLDQIVFHIGVAQVPAVSSA